MNEFSSLGPIQGRVAAILGALDDSFVERETHARLALLCVLSGHHVLLLGPPGTAKSQLARSVAGAVAEASYFEYLLSRFTHPDELFGPVSIPGLKEEDYRRLTDGFLPRAHVAFLDEVFKANSAILNSLLTLINERIFHHGRHRDDAPLLALVGASNEAPEPGGPLSALYDRFLVRLGVAPIADEDAFMKVALGDLAPPSLPREAKLTRGDIEQLRHAASKVAAPAAICDLLSEIRRGLMEASIEASDRRWRWAVDLMRMAAVTSQRDALAPVDVLLLEHCFGDPLENDAAVRGIVREALSAVVDAQGDRRQLVQTWNKMAHAPVAEERTRGGAPRSSAAMTFEAAMGERRDRLDGFRAQLEAAGTRLDEQRDTLLRQAEGTPWVAEVPPSLFAGFVSARRDLATLARLESDYRQQLGSFSLFDTLIPAAQDSQRQQETPDGFMATNKEVPLWISRVGEPPEHWVPVSAEGLMLVDLRGVLAGELQRRLHRLAFYGAPSAPTRVPAWHDDVVHLELHDELLYSLMERGGLDGDVHIDRWLGEAPESSKVALAALVEWLKGLGMDRLPKPPPAAL